MINFSGYGLIIVLVDYFGGLALLSRYSPYFLKSEKKQYLVLLMFHVLITCFNFFMGRYLNKNGVRHTVYGIRLEYFVLATGLIVLPLIIGMGRGIVY